LSIEDAIGLWNAVRIKTAGSVTGWIGSPAQTVASECVSAAERLCIMVGDPAAFALAPCGNPILAQRMKAVRMRANGKTTRTTMIASSASGPVGATAIDHVELGRWYELEP